MSAANVHPHQKRKPSRFKKHYRGTAPSAFGACGIVSLRDYFTDRYDHLPWVKEMKRLDITTMSNPQLSGKRNVKNCSVACAARLVHYWREKGVIHTEDPIDEIYRRSERIAVRYGYRDTRGLRAFYIDDLCKKLFSTYGVDTVCKGIYRWDFKKDLKPEIDAGRPVILNIASGYYHNHSLIVTGYIIYHPNRSPDLTKRTARFKPDHEWVLLIIADGWSPQPRFLDLGAFNKEFPTFGLSSLNTVRLIAPTAE